MGKGPPGRPLHHGGIEYVEGERGPLVHWTHRDPRGRHAAGWLRHNGKYYE